MKALAMTQKARLELLRNHPATAARIYDAKQECLWQQILLGTNRPLGIITDYWRRVEVISCHASANFTIRITNFEKTDIPNVTYY